ncbi:MAG: AgmX/PglI C-terminal domain-containing protein, partial [Myxococcales bacterium]|nr:AgmX/PglI C-terminal domain-containing protein [Myxococcales bacterium]
GGSGEGKAPIEQQNENELPFERAPLPTTPSSSLPPETLQLDLSESEVVAPFSLTASDGTGLRVVALKARGVVDEPLAFTELHMTFENPEDRTIEGRFQIDMPPGAAISRFAMKIGDRWQEGEVVERKAAQQAYEDFLHRRQDPALLENKAGNQFSARVFPIPPRARKELIISFSQELPSSSEPYRLLLRGLPQLDELDARVIIRERAGETGPTTSLGGSATNQQVIEIKKQAFTPDRDLEVRSKREHQALGLRHENLSVARIAPVADLPADPIDGLTILFDTSASRALGYGRQVQRLGDVVAALRTEAQGEFSLRVVCFDQELEQVYEGPASGFGKQHLDRIFSRRPLGASDLEGALAGVGRAGAVGSRLLLFTDGIATAGATEGSALRATATALGAAGYKRVDAIVDGGIQDAELLAQLTTTPLGGQVKRAGAVIDARLPVATIAHKLARATLSGVEVTVPGAEWVWPTNLDGVQPGDEVLVYADLAQGRPMRIQLTGTQTATHDVSLIEAPRPLLERAWVGARIKKLGAQMAASGEDADVNEALKNQIITLSTRHRVLSDYTALLVLETEWDYQRFGIDRNALADILTVGADGITVVDRKPADVFVPEPWVDTRPLPPTRTIREIDEEAEEDGDMPADEGGAEEPGFRGASKGGGAPPPPRAPAGEFKAEEEPAMRLSDDFAKDSAAAAEPMPEPTAAAEKPSPLRKSRPKVDAKEDKAIGGTPRAVLMRVTVGGDLEEEAVKGAIRRVRSRVEKCYADAVGGNASLAGKLTVELSVATNGSVSDAKVKRSTVSDSGLESCVTNVLKSVTMPLGASTTTVTAEFSFSVRGNAPMRADVAPIRVRPRPVPEPTPAPPEPPKPVIVTPPPEPPAPPVDGRAWSWEPRPDPGSPYEGRFLAVMQKIQDGDRGQGLEMALAWRSEQPGDVLALIALGEALEAHGDVREAARAYGSIVDLFPSRADLRRYAGARLERLGEAGLKKAVDTFEKAVEQRPDHPSSHRHYAFALSRAGQHEQAFEAMLKGYQRSYPAGRFAGVPEILREDLGLLAAAWIAAEPQRRSEIEGRLRDAGVELATRPSLRFILSWETDANDVDFHIRDAQGGHAWYSSKSLPSGGRLYADV